LDNVFLDETKAFDSAQRGYLNATELADYLVRKGVPFRSAHHAVGEAVLFAITRGKELNELELEDLKQFSGEIEKDVFISLSLECAVASKDAIGGTSPKRVNEALKKARRSLQLK
jgi:argininosuccinate lyase